MHLSFLEDCLAVDSGDNHCSQQVSFTKSAFGKWVLDILSAKEIEAEENRAFQWTRDLGGKPILKGKSLIEIMEMEEASLWWTQEYWFYESPIMGYTVPELFKVSAAIKKWIETVKPETIYFDSPRTELHQIVMDIARSRNISLQTGPRLKNQIRRYKPFVIELGKQCKQFFRHIVTKVHPLFRASYRIGLVNVMGIAYDADFGECMDNHGNTSWGNRQIGALVQSMQKTGVSNLWLEREANPRFSLKKMLNKLPGFVPFEGFWNVGLEGQVIRKRAMFSKAWRELDRQQSHPEYFKVSGINLWPALKDRIKLLLLLRASEAFRNVLVLKNALEKHRPKAVVLTDEGDSFGRTMLIASKACQVPSVGIQHGFLHPTHFAYGYQENLETGARLRPFSCPVPTVTCVYGSYAFKVLTERSCFPKQSVVITGAPKFDYLLGSDRIFDNNQVMKDLGLNPELKTVTLITQPFPDLTEREEILRTVCSCIKELPDVQLVVKLHPGEFDIETPRSIFNEYGLPGSVIREYNTHAILASSDLMLCKNSTTVLEAALIGCKVMTVNLRSEKEYVPIAGIGGIKEVHSKLEMLETLKKELEDPVFRSRLELLNYHLCNEDGRATYRVMNVINSVARNKVVLNDRKER